MTNQHARDIKDLFNKTAYDVNGDKLGSVKEVFVDDHSGQPTFVEVSHGLFGMSESIVPMRGHKFAGEDDLILAFDKERIKDAPSVDTDKALSTNDQNEIFRHYGVDTKQDEQAYTGGRHDASDKNNAGLVAGAGSGAGVGAAAGAEHKEHAHKDHVAGTETADHAQDAGHTHSDVDGRDSLVRSEEQLDVSKERVESGEVRLRKYVVTETENIEVPVTREEVRVERTPISEEEAASMRGKNELTDDEASVILHEERVRVEKDTVPVEKVELNKREVTDTERVSEDLRKERIETEGVDGKTTK